MQRGGRRVFDTRASVLKADPWLLAFDSHIQLWRRKSEGFDAPDEAGGPGFLGGERGAPEGENLGALVDALEALLGFGDGFDRGDPELLGCRGVQGNADALPAVFHAQDGTGQRATESKIVAAGGSIEEAVGLWGGGRKLEEVGGAGGARGDWCPFGARRPRLFGESL